MNNKKNNNNITENVPEENGLLSGNNYSEQIINSLPGVYYLISVEGRFVSWNENFLEISGYSKEELGKMSPLDLFEGDDKTNIERKIREVFEVGISSADALLITKGNKKIPYYFSGKKIEINGAFFLCGLGLDISEKTEAEKKLKESEERFKALFENAPDAMYLNDMSGNFIDGNKASELLTGYKRDELIGENFLKLKLLTMAGIARAAKDLLWAEIGKPIGPDEYEINRKDGSRTIAEVISIPMELGGKTIELGIARDITERKNAEEAMRQRNEELEKFNKISVDREIKMIELKKKIEELEEKLKN
jgi:PAS domain S-box-containing protein